MRSVRSFKRVSSLHLCAHSHVHIVLPFTGPASHDGSKASCQEEARCEELQHVVVELAPGVFTSRVLQAQQFSGSSCSSSTNTRKFGCYAIFIAASDLRNQSTAA